MVGISRSHAPGRSCLRAKRLIRVLSKRAFHRGGTNTMSRLTLLLAFLFTALPVAAKDVYVAQAQAGNGSGTACSTAKPITWLSSSASWGTSATQINAGTTVHLCGTITGSPGQQLFLVRTNGTSASPITIKWETNAILTAPYWSAMGAIYAVGRS